MLGALEQIEALRFAEFLAPCGLAVVNAQAITPVTVSMGAAKYPKDVEAGSRRSFPGWLTFGRREAAAALGNVRPRTLLFWERYRRGWTCR